MDTLREMASRRFGFAEGYESAAEQIRKRADGLDEDCSETLKTAKRLRKILKDREQRLNGLSWIQ